MGIGSAIKNALSDRDSTNSSNDDVAPMNKTHRPSASTDSGYTSNDISGTSPVAGTGASAARGHAGTATTSTTSPRATTTTGGAAGMGVGRDTTTHGATNVTTGSTTSPRTGGTAPGSMASRGRDAEAARAGVGAAAADRDNDHGATRNTSGVGRALRDNVGGTGPTGSGAATEDGYEPVTHIGGQRPGDLTDPHRQGHPKGATSEIKPTGQGKISEDTNQLKHVVHDNVRHIETEEVLREKYQHRHVHHVQHHVQPIRHVEERDEIHHQQIHPVTHVHEKHASKAEDAQFLNAQIKEHKDTVQHGAKERQVVDMGTHVNEHTHHHLHHVIQPVIEKETLEKHRIHTVIPTREETHEAPIIHESTIHAPLSMNEFLHGGRKLDGGVAHGEIGNKVLHGGECSRDVDGVGERLAEQLHLSPAHPSDLEHVPRTADRTGARTGTNATAAGNQASAI